jgi:hypothetical protein
MKPSASGDGPFDLIAVAHRFGTASVSNDLVAAATFTSVKVLVLCLSDCLRSGLAVNRTRKRYLRFLRPWADHGVLETSA